jgi:hypothetical protein
MTFKCDYCLKAFDSLKKLQTHLNTAKYCIDLKNIIFKCKTCNFETDVIQNIKTHICNTDTMFEIEDDDMEENKNTVIQKTINNVSIQTEIEATSSQKINYKQLYKKYKRNFENSQVCLSMERLKNKIYIQIIEQNTNIKLKDIIDEKDEYINIYTNFKKLPTIYIHENSSNNKDTTKLLHESPKNKKSSFKSLKCINPIKEPENEEKLVKVKEINENIYSVISNDPKLNDIEGDINTQFNELKNTTNTRQYNKILETIKNRRLSIIRTLTFNEYKKLLLSHNDYLTKIFKSKEINDKKINSFIEKSLSTIDLRILFYGNYINFPLDIDERDKFNICLNLSYVSEPRYEPFNINYISEKFHNYGTVIFSIEDNVKRYLINTYGYNNIIYVSLPKSNDTDPYSFYYLDSVNKDKRNWKMDCRLEEITNNLSSSIKMYLVSIFRRIYFDVFKDNIYRKSYKINPVLENDCTQLLQTLFLVSNFIDFSNILKTIIKEHATFALTDNDKFNIQGDDVLQKKRLLSLKKNNTDMVIDTIKILFDNITLEEAVDFYRTFEKN